jgi:hypothetical protein
MYLFSSASRRKHAENKATPFLRLVLAAARGSGSAFEVQGSPASWLLQGAAVIVFYI